METGKLIALATSAAALFLAGCATPGTDGGTPATQTKVNCAGANACKGLSECHSAKNECAGQNGCRGQGWLSLTPQECKKATGA